jgi:hypothetical protein
MSTYDGTVVLPSNSRRPSPGSWISSWLLQRRHPDAFGCGVRVVEGAVAGESSRWRFRDSAIDRHASGEVIALNHGSKVSLRLRVGEPLDLRTRPNHVVLSAVEVTAGALVQISVPLGELATFGIDI